MATTCPRCGASLAAGAQFCAVCGQSTAPAPPPPATPPPVAAGSNRMPIAALIVLLGGLVVLVGAFWLYQSGNLPGMGGSATPVAATPGAPSDAGAPPPASADATTPPVAAPAAGVPAAVPPAPAPEAAPPAGGVTAAPPAGAPAGVAAPAPPPLAPIEAKPAPPPPPPFEKTYECRKYAAFKIDPDTAIVAVDDEIIGIADEWADTPRTKKYEFKKEGVHYVKLSHRDYKTIWLRFKVSDKADDKTAVVELEMKKGNDKDVKDVKDEKKKDEKKKDDKKKDEKKKDEKK
jgi:hypothetical protein